MLVIDATGEAERLETGVGVHDDVAPGIVVELLGDAAVVEVDDQFGAATACGHPTGLILNIHDLKYLAVLAFFILDKELHIQVLLQEVKKQLVQNVIYFLSLVAMNPTIEKIFSFPS